MSAIIKLTAAALAGAIMIPCVAVAAAPDKLDASAPPPPSGLIAPIRHRMGTELIVHNWVLCVSQDKAEAIAKARAEGIDEARAAYADLVTAKSCGQFAEMHVILHKALYPTGNVANDPAHVYSAAISLSGHWANAYVVEGGLPAEH